MDVDPSGKIVKEIKLLPEGKDGGHAYMRNARRLANGGYLVTHNGESVVREYDAQGKVVLEIPAAGGHYVIEPGKPYGPEKPVWHYEAKNRTDFFSSEISGAHRLPNGNTVVSNWLGHGNFGKAPHLIEVTPDKKVVWTYANHEAFKTISSVQLLDVKGDATKNEIAH